MHDYRHNVTKFRFTQQYKYNVGIKFLELYQIFGINITRHFLMRYLIQWKPLNVITLGQRQTDKINRMITLSEQSLW